MTKSYNNHLLFFSSQSNDHQSFNKSPSSLLFERSNVMIYYSVIEKYLASEVKNSLIDRYDDQYHSWAFIDFSEHDYQAVFFDMDGTIISQESSVQLADNILSSEVKKQISDLTKDSMEGKIDFKKSLKKKFAKFGGINKSDINNLLDQLTLNPGVEQLISHFYLVGIPCYLVTGGISTVAIPIAKKLGISGVCANVPQMIPTTNINKDQNTDQNKNHSHLNQQKEHQDWEFTGKLLDPIIDGYGKAKYLKDICSKLEIHPDNSISVGDGANDIEISKLAKLAVGYYPKSVLLPYLNVVNCSGNHLFIIDLLDHYQNIKHQLVN